MDRDGSATPRIWSRLLADSRSIYPSVRSCSGSWQMKMNVVVKLKHLRLIPIVSREGEVSLDGLLLLLLLLLQ